MGRLLESIGKYTRALGVGAAPADAGAAPADAGDAPARTGRRAAGAPSRASCQPILDRPSGKGRRETPERVERRPDPAQWSEHELLALHEAVALLWPDGPVTVSSLRTAIAKGELAYVRLAGRIYTTRAACAAMAACAAGDGGADRKPRVDWDAHLKTLLPKRGDSSR